jgi:hypothetical protein
MRIADSGVCSNFRHASARYHHGVGKQNDLGDGANVSRCFIPGHVE